MAATTIAGHKQFCLRGAGRINWWPWSRGVPCECPHREIPITADEVAKHLNANYLSIIHNKDNYPMTFTLGEDLSYTLRRSDDEPFVELGET